MNTRKYIESYLRILAFLIIRRCRPTIIAVTGSVGKTTTTNQIANMMANIVEQDSIKRILTNVTVDQWNQNDTVGVPLAILQCNHYLRRDMRGFKELISISFRAFSILLSGKYPDFLILEFGISRIGEMERLVSIAPPDIAVITAVGPSHLEGLGSVDKVADEKSKLIRGVPVNGFVLLGADNQWTNEMVALTAARVELIPGRGIELAENIARAIGRFMGFTDIQIDNSFANIQRPPHRLSKELVNGINLIDDSYNASPLSMQLGLDMLAMEKCPGRKIAILGLMAELGKDSEKYHREIGIYAKSQAELVFGIGEYARGYEPDYWFPDIESCCASLPNLIKNGDCVLVKGSHSASLHMVAKYIKSKNMREKKNSVGSVGKD